jgi:membrane protease YdiL (CAAX protease family)
MPMKITKAFLLTIILYVSYKTVAAILPSLIGSYDNYLSNFESYEFDNFQGFSWIFGMIFSYLLMFKIIGIPQLNFEKIKHWKKHDLFYIVVIGVGLRLLVTPIHNISDVINFYATGIFKNNTYEFHLDLVFIYTCISFLLVSPILEELFFRRILFNRLKQNYSTKYSILISSVCFSIIHIDLPNNLVPTFLLGLSCAILYNYSKNIKYSLLLHLVYNICWFIETTQDYYVNWRIGLHYNLTYWTLSLVGLFIIILGMKKITVANKA